jgi:hypothetical protein
VVGGKGEGVVGRGFQRRDAAGHLFAQRAAGGAQHQAPLLLRGFAGLRLEQEAGHAPDRVALHHHLALAGDGGEQLLLRVVQAADEVGGAAVHEARGEALVQGVRHRVLGGAGLVLEAGGVAQPIGAGGDVGPDADGGEARHQRVEVALDVAECGDLPGHPLVRQRAVLGQVAEDAAAERGVAVVGQLAEVRHLAGFPEQADAGAAARPRASGPRLPAPAWTA